VVEIRRTDEFDKWLARLKDRQARSRILARIARLGVGNPGDVKSVGGGVNELRIAHGPGYRLYFTRQGVKVVILLIGGDKSSQDRDIAKAKELAADLEEGS